MTAGTKVAIRLGGGVTETGKIARRFKDHVSPADGYELVRFDNGGAVLWVHASGLTVA